MLNTHFRMVLAFPGALFSVLLIILGSKLVLFACLKELTDSVHTFSGEFSAVKFEIQFNQTCTCITIVPVVPGNYPGVPVLTRQPLGTGTYLLPGIQWNLKLTMW
jgi:hypothetical protein